MNTRDTDAANLINSAGSETDARRAEHEIGEFGLDGARLDGGPKRTVEVRFGLAILRLRLYMGWSQRDLQRTSGVHQSQISRLETGRQHGLSSRRIFAILRALHVHDIAFLPPPTNPPTELELMLWGDPWERASRAAERRVNHRRSA